MLFILRTCLHYHWAYYENDSLVLGLGGGGGGGGYFHLHVSTKLKYKTIYFDRKRKSS